MKQDFMKLLYLTVLPFIGLLISGCQIETKNSQISEDEVVAAWVKPGFYAQVDKDGKKSVPLRITRNPGKSLTIKSPSGDIEGEAQVRFAVLKDGTNLAEVKEASRTTYFGLNKPGGSGEQFSLYLPDTSTAEAQPVLQKHGFEASFGGATELTPGTRHNMVNLFNELLEIKKPNDTGLKFERVSENEWNAIVKHEREKQQRKPKD